MQLLRTILRRKIVWTGELKNTIWPEGTQKACVDDRRILSLLRKKKHPFTTVGKIKKTLQDVGVSVSKSTRQVNHW